MEKCGKGVPRGWLQTVLHQANKHIAAANLHGYNIHISLLSIAVCTHQTYLNEYSLRFQFYSTHHSSFRMTVKRFIDEDN